MLDRARVLILMLFVLLCGGGCSVLDSPRGPGLRVTDYRVVEENGVRELRLLVHTDRTWTEMGRIGGHRGGGDNSRLWLAVVDLNKQGALSERTRLYGPLWADTDERHLQVELSWNGFYFEGDQPATSAEVWIGFGADGGIERVRSGPGGAPALRDRLNLTERAARFVHYGDVAPVGRTPSYYYGQLTCEGASIMVRHEADGRCRVYNSRDGAPKDDAWLSAAFCDFQSREDLSNNHVWLPDADHLVVRPEDFVTLLPTSDKPQRSYDHFTLDGRRIDRQQYGVLYTRPDPRPRLFERPESGLPFRDDPPYGAFSVDGRLALLNAEGFTLELFTPATEGAPSTMLYRLADPPGVHWLARSAFGSRFDDRSGTIVFADDLDGPDRLSGGQPLNLVTWYFREGRIRRDTVLVEEFFSTWFNTYKPRAAIPVEGR